MGSERLVLRPVKAVDHDTLRELVTGVGNEELTSRFLQGTQLRAGHPAVPLSEVDGDRHLALVAHIVEAEGADAYVAVGRYDVDPATRMADVRVGVSPDWQRRGIGSIVLQRLHDIARARGFSGMKARVAAENKPMLTLLYNSGLSFSGSQEGDGYDLKVRFDDDGGSGRSRTGHPDLAGFPGEPGSR